MDEKRTEEEIERGIGAIIAIDDFLRTLRKYYDELEQEIEDPTKSTFDTGLLLGYRQALEMMEARADIYGVYPDGEED